MVRGLRIPGACRLARAAVVLTAALLLLPAAALATTITVNTTSDAAPVAGECAGTAGDCSLRQAIAAAQTGDTVALGGTNGSPSTYAVTLGTIVIGSQITIQGAGPAATTVDGTHNVAGSTPTRIFKVTNAGSATFSSFTVTGGNDDNDENLQACSPCLTLNANGGGALYNVGTASVTDVAFAGNGSSGTPLGGGISNRGTLTLTDDSFTSNGAAFGAGLAVRGGTATVTGSTFENNGNGGFGGGAIFLDGGTATVSNSTIVGNGWGSSRGGGIENAAQLTLTNDTLSENIRGAIQTDQGGATSVENTIIGAGFSDNVDYGCVASGQSTEAYANTTTAITNDLGNNLDEDGHCGLSGSGNVSSVSADLAPIADNGGGTRTVALLHGSPAIDAANAAACPTTDQRGVSRPQGSVCDIGAFEAQTLGAPAVLAQAVTAFTYDDATLPADVNTAGEGGELYFNWGTAANALTNQTSALGVDTSTATRETVDFSGLTPNTTYFVQAVAVNASGQQVAAGQPESFTTPPPPPVVSQPVAFNVYDVHGDAGASVDPSGLQTHWRIDYATDASFNQNGGSYDRHTASIAIGANAGPQSVSQALTALTPGTTYHYDVVATNSSGSAESGDMTFTTTAQFTGAASVSTSLTQFYTAIYDVSCPTTPQHVDWGDGSGSDIAPDCDVPVVGDYSLSATHTYAHAGHYDISVGPAGSTVPAAGAQIAAAPLTAAPVTVTATAGTSFTSTLATFSSADTSATAGDFTASIDWGDGAQGTGTITPASGGGFTLSGSHSYPTAGLHIAVVAITATGGGSATVRTKVDVNPPPPAPTPPPTSPPPAAAVAGNVELLRSSMASPSGNLRPADAGARVQLTLGPITRTATTNGAGNFSFTKLPACDPATGATCSVAVLDSGGAVSDRVKVTVPATASTVRVQLYAGRAEDRYYVLGSIALPRRTHGAPPATDLTVSVQRNGKLSRIYDALQTCRAERWRLGGGAKPSCASTFGSFQLDGIRPTNAGTHYVITLLEASRQGGTYVPVASETLSLPADTAASQVYPPPITRAGKLVALEPVPRPRR